MDFKSAGNRVALIEASDAADPAALGRLHRAMAKLIRAGRVMACHDVSDGGIAVAAAEMCIASGLGLAVNESFLGSDAAFAQSNGRFLVELSRSIDGDAIERELGGTGGVSVFGIVQPAKAIKIAGRDIALDELTAAWRGTLDW
jgi:phosphoribosylformylglycinamidine synthase